MDAKSRAEEIYLCSVGYENSFTPISFEKLSSELAREGIEVSSSTLQRWSVSLGWKDKARKKAENLSHVGSAKNIATKEEINTLLNLGKIGAGGSKIMLDFIEMTMAKERKTLDEIELVLKITTASFAMQGKGLELDAARNEGEKLSITQVRESFKNVKIEDIIDGEVEE